MSEATVQARLVGALFVERGLLTPEQLDRALEIQAETGELLGEVLISEFGLSRVELASVLAEQWAELEREPVTVAPDVEAPSLEPAERRRIGEIFVERGFVTQAELEHALEVQAGSGRPLGEVLIDLGNLTRLDLAGALAEQWSSLEKLRPPAPKPAEPWQQVAPIAHAAAVAQGVGRVSEEEPAPTRDDPELGAAVAALAARMAALEEAGASEHWAIELRASLDALSARLDSVEASPSPGGTTDVELESLRAALVDLSERMAVPEGRLAALEGRLEALAADERTDERLAALESRPPQTPGLDEVSGELAELRAAVGELAVAAGGADERCVSLETRVDELAAAASGLEGRVATQPVRDGLAERLAALESRPPETPWVGELAELRAAVEELAVAAGGADERRVSLEARVGELESRPPEAPWSDELTRLQAALESRLDAVSERADALARETPWSAELAEVRADVARLRDESRREITPAAWNEMRDELAGLRRSVAESDAAADGRLDLLAARLDDIVRTTDGLQSAEATGASAVEVLASRIAAVEESVAAAASATGETITEQTRQVEAGLASCFDRLQRLEDTVAATAAVRPVAEADLRAALEASEARQAEQSLVRDETIVVLRRRLEEVAAADGVRAEQVREVEGELRAILDGVATRAEEAVADTASRLAALEELAASVPSAADAVRRELAAVETRLRAAETAAGAAAQAEAQSRDAAETVSARITTIEAALFARATDSVEPRVAALERRLEDEVAQADERARAVDRALRKGLATLSQTLADNETAYMEAGNTLRASLERLGRVVTDADVRIASRDAAAAHDGHGVDADAYVAFVPTPEGYRLVAVGGPPPRAGDTVDLEGHGPGLVATRIGTSPIPLDTRACAYLDRPGDTPPE